MKICFVAWNPFGAGGISRVVSLLASELSKEHDISILCLKRNPGNYYNMDLSKIRMSSYEQSLFSKERREILNRIEKYVPLYKFDIVNRNYINIRYPHSFRKHIINYINQNNFDVVIGATGLQEAVLIGGISNKIQAKTLGWLHTTFDLYFNKQKGKMYYDNTLIRSRYFLNKLDGCIVLSRYDQQKLAIENIKSYAIYNSIRLPIVKSDIHSGNYKRIIYAGALNRYVKGVDVLIDGFKIFSQKNHDWCLDIYGEGPDRDFLEQKIIEYDLSERVSIHSYTAHIEDEFAKSDLLLFTSRIEGFGLVMIEAMSVGLPVVVSDLPITRELVKDRGVGWLFENGNPEDLADKLFEAVNADLKLYSHNALHYAETFSVEKIVKKWTELCEIKK